MSHALKSGGAISSLLCIERAEQKAGLSNSLMTFGLLVRCQTLHTHILSYRLITSTVGFDLEAATASKLEAGYVKL